MDKSLTTKYVLIVNAIILLCGTIAQSFDNPVKNFVLSCLLIAWVATLVWHVGTASVSAQ